MNIKASTGLCGEETMIPCYGPSLEEPACMATCFEHKRSLLSTTYRISHVLSHACPSHTGSVLSAPHPSKQTYPSLPQTPQPQSATRKAGKTSAQNYPRFRKHGTHERARIRNAIFRFCSSLPRNMHVIYHIHLRNLEKFEDQMNGSVRLFMGIGRIGRWSGERKGLERRKEVW